MQDDGKTSVDSWNVTKCWLVVMGCSFLWAKPLVYMSSKAEVVWWECAVAGLAFGLGFLFHKLLSSSKSSCPASTSSTAQSVQDGRNHRKIAQDLFELIGDTPMIKLQSLSNATGCTILAKCEFMNPGICLRFDSVRMVVGRTEWVCDENV